MEEELISQEKIDTELGAGFDFAKVEVSEVIPQRPPFVMVDSLVRFDASGVETSFTVREDNILLEDGFLDPSAVLENIAQSCAVRIGFISKYILHKGVDIGYICAIRDMKIGRRPSVGETLRTRISVRDEIMGMTIVEAEVFSAEGTVASGTMSTALKKDN
ncbi:MAG: pseudouridylate synthase [Bacteroidales bacterium]|nr:pseudouridylate synthase [Bacteroidales bacterium]